MHNMEEAIAEVKQKLMDDLDPTDTKYEEKCHLIEENMKNDEFRQKAITGLQKEKVINMNLKEDLDYHKLEPDHTKQLVWKKFT